MYLGRLDGGSCSKTSAAKRGLHLWRMNHRDIEERPLGMNHSSVQVDSGCLEEGGFIAFFPWETVGS